MGSRNPVVVVGVCAPERRSYAERLAQAIDGHLAPLTDGQRARGRQPVEFSAAHPSIAWRPAEIVADLASELDLPHLPLTQDPDAFVICVVDTVHLGDDLRDGSPLIAGAPEGDDRRDFGSRARRAVSYIEGATLVAFVNWESTPTSELSLLMALASHLNPTARVRLSRGPAEDFHALRASPRFAPPLLERAGWVRSLNDEHDPHMTDPRVTTVRYEQPRPFHPARLRTALDDLASGDHGAVLRSAGFCRLASRTGILARWDQVGPAIWIDPLSTDIENASTVQDLAVTGLNLDHAGLRVALDDATVTDDELTAGPAAWRRFSDTFPAWPFIADEAGRTGGQ